MSSTRGPLSSVLRALSLAIVLLVTSRGLAQGASESLEREARSAFKAGRFKEAAIKFQDAAASATEAPRRAKMELQAAYSFFNDKNTRSAREAVKRALDADPDIEIVAEFYAPDFLRLVDELKRSARPTPAPAPVDIGELKRVAAEKLRDGHADEVVYDLTSVPPERLDADSWQLLAKAYESLGRTEQAAAARRAAAGDRSGIASTFASPSVARPTGDMNAVLAAGRDALKAGDAVAAQAAANRVLESQPTSSEAFRLLADVFLSRGDKALAEANWKQSLRYDVRNEAALESLFDYYVNEKNVPSAISTLQMTSVLGGKSQEKLVALGRRLSAEGDFAHAKQAFAVAVAAAPSDARILSEYAGVLLAGGDVDAALDPLKKAVALSPTSAVAHANLAAGLRRKAQAAEAEREYREAIRLDPDSATALQGLAVLLLEANRSAEAIELFKRAVARDARDVQAVLGLARAQRASGDAAGAAATLQAAQDLDDASLMNEQGAVAYALGRYSEAAGFFERALSRDPGSELARANREKAREAARFAERLEKQSPMQRVSSATAR